MAALKAYKQKLENLYDPLDIPTLEKCWDVFINTVHDKYDAGADIEREVIARVLKRKKDQRAKEERYIMQEPIVCVPANDEELDYGYDMFGEPDEVTEAVTESVADTCDLDIVDTTVDTPPVCNTVAEPMTLSETLVNAKIAEIILPDAILIPSMIKRIHRKYVTIDLNGIEVVLEYSNRGKVDGGALDEDDTPINLDI